MKSGMNHPLHPKARRKHILTATLPDPVTKNIEAILSMHNQEVKSLAGHQHSNSHYEK